MQKLWLVRWVCVAAALMVFAIPRPASSQDAQYLATHPDIQLPDCAGYYQQWWSIWHIRDYGHLAYFLQSVPLQCPFLRLEVSEYALAAAQGSAQRFGYDGSVVSRAEQDVALARRGVEGYLQVATVPLPSFPWPPPTPSTQTVIPSSWLSELTSSSSLYDVGEHFRSALDESGYTEIGFYGAPGGFVIISRLERILDDGRPALGDFRYMPPESEPFSLTHYLTSIFVAPVGRYRVIAFVVTDRAFTATGNDISAGDARSLLRRSANRLPASFRNTPFSAAHQVTALVYEFEKVGAEANLRLVAESRVPARLHLERSGLREALRE